MDAAKNDSPKLFFADIIVGYFDVLGIIIVAATMSIMFFKHGKPLSDSTRVKITERFMLVFTDSDMLEEINEERLT